MLLGLAALLPAAAPAGAASCNKSAPRALNLQRATGSQTAKLSWKAPKRAAKRQRYRVYRDGSVVGQTARRSMKVRVSLDRRHVFAVRTLDRRGKLSPCKARLTRKLAYTLPGAPHDLGILDVADKQATLGWSPVQPGDAPVVGYRIFQGEAVLRQVAATSATVRLASASSHQLSVAAVDRAGNVGPRSATVTVRTGHIAPDAPSDLGSFKITDSEVGLSWPAARERSDHVVGYRVYRDGQIVTQVEGLSQVVDNLAAFTGYEFTVAAVDGLGYVSAPSKALAVKTAMPPPTEGDAHAFLLATTDQSFKDLQAHYQRVGTVYPTYFECRSDGSIEGQEDPLVTGWAKLRQIAVLPRFDCQSQSRLHLMLTDMTVRARVISDLVALVDQYGYDGINIDFEAGAATDRDALTAFVTALATQLHARGKRVTVEVSAKTTETFTGRSGFYDYADLGAVADNVYVMCWGLHWSTSVPGSVDDIRWATKVADYTATIPSKQRFVLGFPFYGMDWPNGGGAQHRATALEYDDVLALAARVGANPALDSATQSLNFSYDEQGTHHDVWFSDRTTLATRIAVANSRGIGIGFWRLGEEDQSVWDDPLLSADTVWPGGHAS